MFTEDEILTACEDRWRQAALDGTPQFRGTAYTTSWREILRPDNSTCAVLILTGPRENHTNLVFSTWHCLECGYRSHSMWVAIVHLNNAHDWAWDMFAGKFRDVWEAGKVK